MMRGSDVNPLIVVYVGRFYLKEKILYREKGILMKALYKCPHCGELADGDGQELHESIRCQCCRTQFSRRGYEAYAVIFDKKEVVETVEI